MKISNAFCAILLLTILLIPSYALMYQIKSFFNASDKQMLDALLNENYNRHERPDPDEEVTLVNVSVILLTISSPDESSLRYEVEFLLYQNWIDKRIAFNETPKGKHKYLNALQYRNQLWMPDTYFLLKGEFKEFKGPVDPVHMALKVFPNGTVVYITRRYMIITCEGHLNIFPFDSPRCFFAFESMSYESAAVVYQWNSANENRVTNTSSFRSLNAYLIKNRTGECKGHHTWRTEFSCLSVLLVFTRDKSFYFITVFVPGMVLVTSSFISFWLDVNAVPARVMIGVTTMLNFCTTTNSFRSSLPVVSNLTAMNLWDGVCLFFIYASMLEFIIVNYLHRKIHHSSTRPQSGDRHSEVPRPTIANPMSGNGRKMCDSVPNECLPQNQVKDEFEVRAPLVGGDDPSIIGSQLNHRQTRALSPLQTQPQPLPSGSLQGEDRIRAAASVFAWLRRPHIWDTQEITAQARLARSIDHISKIVFPLLFGVFSLTFFIFYALYSPSKVNTYIDREYKSDPDTTQAD